MLATSDVERDDGFGLLALDSGCLELLGGGEGVEGEDGCGHALSLVAASVPGMVRVSRHRSIRSAGRRLSVYRSLPRGRLPTEPSSFGSSWGEA